MSGAVAGEPFVIARASKPLVKVTVIEDTPPQRLGFLAGQLDVPEDFDTMGSADIEALFGGLPDTDDIKT